MGSDNEDKIEKKKNGSLNSTRLEFKAKKRKKRRELRNEERKKRKEEREKKERQIFGYELDTDSLLAK